MIYNLFPKFHVKHERFSFYGHRKPEEGADTDVICNFCWPKSWCEITTKDNASVVG